MTEATEKTERNRDPQGRNEAVVSVPTDAIRVRQGAEAALRAKMFVSDPALKCHYDNVATELESLAKKLEVNYADY